MGCDGAASGDSVRAGSAVEAQRPAESREGVDQGGAEQSLRGQRDGGAGDFPLVLLLHPEPAQLAR